MPLIHYRQFLTYPDGNPAANTLFPLALLGGNSLVPTFADKAGTIPLPNPVLTGADGLIDFYAAPGAYAVDVAGAVVHIVVHPAETDDAWPGTFVHAQPVAAATWTVNHHFGVEPNVSILVAGQSAEADVTHPTTEQTVITFGSPVSGTALLRR
jgi:hypothetical protein